MSLNLDGLSRVEGETTPCGWNLRPSGNLQRAVLGRERHFRVARPAQGPSGDDELMTMTTTLSSQELLAAAASGGIPTPLVIVGVLVLAVIGYFGITRGRRK